MTVAQTNTFELPLELWEHVVHHLDSFNDYRAMTCVNQRMSGHLQRAQSRKRHLIASQGPGATLLFLLRQQHQGSSCPWEPVFQAFLKTPGVITLESLGSRALHTAIGMQQTSSKSLLTERKQQFLSMWLYNHREQMDRSEVQHIIKAAFRTAVTYSEIPLIEMLFRNVPAGMAFLNESEVSSWMVRSLCDQSNGAQTVHVLLQHGLSFAREHHLTAVQLLTSHGHVATLDLLLGGLREKDRETCLASAWSVCTYEGNVDVARLLLCKYRMNPRAEGNAGLRWSSRRGYTAFFALLTEFGLELTSEEGEFHLYSAIRNQYVDIVRSLLQDHHVSVHTQQQAALREACRIGSLSIVRSLLEHGAQSGALHFDAIRLAKEHGHREVHELLLAHSEQERKRQGQKTSAYRQFIDTTGVAPQMQGDSQRTWL